MRTTREAYKQLRNNDRVHSIQQHEVLQIPKHFRSHLQRKKAKGQRSTTQQQSQQLHSVRIEENQNLPILKNNVSKFKATVVDPMISAVSTT